MSETSTMEGDLPVEYYTEAGRLESFQIAHPMPKRRDSSTKGRGAKPAKWPHSWLEPKSLAEAGFIYMPEPGNLDNVQCFLCRRSICGWTDGDEPLAEHLKLSPDCGWAITSCIEAKVGDIHLENPMSTRMVEARKATFGDRWPHEGKKGWKCKTKKLVEAGWIYKPTYDGDDFAECIYCTLALDGWEPADKPFHEHHARSADCAFFELCNRPESPITKKAAAKRKPRTSAVKSSARLSMQSTLEPEPSYLEAPSFANDTVQDEGDSIATTTSSIMPKGKGKKATASRGRKKKVEPVVESDDEMNAPSEQEEAPAPPPKATKGRKGKKVKEEPAPVEHIKSVQSELGETLVVEEESLPKPRRGKKRVSDSEVDESIIVPAPKRRTRNSVAMQERLSLMPTESSIHNTQDEISASTPPAAKKSTNTKKKPARASRGRKVSEASIAPASDNERLDQQLEDELDRQLEDMDVENPSRTVSPELLNPKPAMAPLGRKLRNSGGRLENNHHDMFNQMEVDEDEVDREMQQMEEEEQISKPLPKGKGKKGVERKVSVKQQVKEEKARRAVEAAVAQEKIRMENEAAAAQDKIRKEKEAAAEKAAKAAEVAAAKAIKAKGKGKAKAKPKSPSPEPVPEPRPARSPTPLESLHSPSVHSPSVHSPFVLQHSTPIQPAPVEVPKAKGKGKAKAKPRSPSPEPEPEPSPARSPTPEAEPSPARSPTPLEFIQSPSVLSHNTPTQPSASRSALSNRSQRSVRTLSPSASPQSSDAENHPPSSRPSSSVQASSAMTARQALGATTPKTPSRSLNRQPGGNGSLNAKTGLHTDVPWEEVDLDTIFSYMRSPGKENLGQDGESLGKAIVGGELSEEERKMTVEEWIRWNAVRAEERLKAECEALVGVFEREGVRAVRCLEGVDVVDG